MFRRRSQHPAQRKVPFAESPERLRFPRQGKPFPAFAAQAPPFLFTQLRQGLPRIQQPDQKIMPQSPEYPAALQAGFQPAAFFPLLRSMQQPFRHQQEGTFLRFQHLGDGTAPPAAVPVQTVRNDGQAGGMSQRHQP